MNARELADAVMKKLEDYLPVEGTGRFYAEHIESLLQKALKEAERRGQQDCVGAGPCATQLRKARAEAFGEVAIIIEGMIWAHPAAILQEIRQRGRRWEND